MKHRFSVRRPAPRRGRPSPPPANTSLQLEPGATWPLVHQGPGTYGPYRVRWFEGDPEVWLRIGAYCSVGEDVEFMVGGNHRPDFVSTFPFRILKGLPGAFEDGHPSSNGDITVGSDVWIGREALILSGVEIGHGAVVGARAVVARDVRPYAIVVGNPAREVRRRFSDAIVDALLEIRWWDWPEDELMDIVGLLNGGDPESLIDYAHSRG